MRSISVVIVAAFMCCSGVVLAQSWQPPSDDKRCPSKWGPNDQRGSANHQKPETVMRAVKLIRTGEVIELGRVLEESMPMNPGRSFQVMTKRTSFNPGVNRRGTNEELVVAEIGQVGTQFDAFSHQTIGASMYNCYKLDEIATRTGFSKLGVENVGALLTRGVLIDVAALKGVDMLPVHQILLVVNGIHMLENLKLDELATRRIYEFALIIEPLKIKGGTGSTVAPIAVH